MDLWDTQDFMLENSDSCKVMSVDGGHPPGCQCCKPEAVGGVISRIAKRLLSAGNFARQTRKEEMESLAHPGGSIHSRQPTSGPCRRGAIWRPALWGMVLLCAWLRTSAAELPHAREYRIKASFLRNFAEYTEWPRGAFSSTNAPLILSVVGEDPFGDILDSTVRKEAVRGHPFKLLRVRGVAEIPTCHIVYIAKSEAHRLSQIMETVQGKPILMVTDIEGAAEHGAMIQFFTDHNRVRFRINLEATQAAHLTLSSKLLRVAEVIKPRKN